MKTIIERFTYYFTIFSFYVTTVVSIPRAPLLTTVLRIAWLIHLFTTMFLMFFWRMNGGDTSVGGLVGTALFVTNGLANVVTIAEVFIKRRHHRKLQRLQRELDELLERHLEWCVPTELQHATIMLRVFGMLLIFLVCDTLRTWINIRTRGKLSPIYYYTLPTTLALRTRYNHILVWVMQLNARTELLKRSILRLAAQNQPRHKFSTDVWKPYSCSEYETVNAMRLIYGRIHEVFQVVNDCFGWSILIIFMTSFFEFVSNSYWTFAMQKDRSFEKYVLNGGTTVALGTSVTMLFWNTDHSTNNSISIRLSVNMKTIIERFTYYFTTICFYVTTVVPIPRAPLLTTVLRITWLIHLFTTMFLMFFWRMNGGDTSVGGLVGTALFVTNGLANVVTITEVFIKRRHHCKLQRLQRELDELLERHLEWCVPTELEHDPLMLRVFGMLLIFIVCDTLRTWINIRTRGKLSPIYYYAIPTTIALRTRYSHILVWVMQLNARTRLLLRSIRRLAAQNQPRHKFTTDIWQPYSSSEYETINAMRLIYGRIHELFQTVNDCFGWSILIIFMTSFFDFVSNIYWTFTAVLKQQSFEKYVLNGGTTVALGTLVTMLFWNTDNSTNYSRNIGCLIFKLVKPLGNKNYNDLVSEFSLQTLHQQFVITAKDFFNLNLNLLGSMVAAIVTYLVILIQFMFTEISAKEKRDAASTTLAMFNSTTTAQIPLMTPTTAISTLASGLQNLLSAQTLVSNKK